MQTLSIHTHCYVTRKTNRTPKPFKGYVSLTLEPKENEKTGPIRVSKGDLHH